MNNTTKSNIVPITSREERRKELLERALAAEKKYNETVENTHFADPQLQRDFEKMKHKLDVEAYKVHLQTVRTLERADGIW